MIPYLKVFLNLTWCVWSARVASFVMDIGDVICCSIPRPRPPSLKQRTTPTITFHQQIIERSLLSQHVVDGFMFVAYALLHVKTFRC